ncbi:MAG: DUF4349 domain-containing protein [Phycisphaerales bacterium]
MTLEHSNDSLESTLRELTAAPQEYTPSIYADALRQTGRDHSPSVRTPRTHARLRKWGAPLGVAAAVVLVAGAVLPTFTSRSSFQDAAMTKGTAPDAYAAASPAPETLDKHVGFMAPDARPSVSAPSGEQPAGDQITDRIVIRKSSIDIRTTDINGSYAKVSLLLNEALGEHIEDSRRSGEGASSTATLTLRVVSSRTAEVLIAIRGMGTVTNESTTGQDVTTQVIDLEARIRNEKRTETELLGLMERRADAPLAEILELRKHVASVREQIERLTAQRDRTKGLADLATIVVVFTPEAIPAPIAPTGPERSHFVVAIEGAWKGGLRNLGDSVAWLVETAVAGALWWTALAVGGLAASAAIRRRDRRLSSEPAPSL